MNRVVIFYNDQAWLKREADIFDSRVDAQILPSGSVWAGTLLISNNEIQELLDPPALLNPGQEASWDRILQEVRQELYNAL